jgi:hypothetical protein
MIQAAPQTFFSSNNRKKLTPRVALGHLADIDNLQLAGGVVARL